MPSTGRQSIGRRPSGACTASSSSLAATSDGGSAPSRAAASAAGMTGSSGLSRAASRRRSIAAARRPPASSARASCVCAYQSPGSRSTARANAARAAPGSPVAQGEHAGDEVRRLGERVEPPRAVQPAGVAVADRELDIAGGERRQRVRGGGDRRHGGERDTPRSRHAHGGRAVATERGGDPQHRDRRCGHGRQLPQPVDRRLGQPRGRARERSGGDRPLRLAPSEAGAEAGDEEPGEQDSAHKSSLPQSAPYDAMGIQRLLPAVPLAGVVVREVAGSGALQRVLEQLPGRHLPEVVAARAGALRETRVEARAPQRRAERDDHAQHDPAAPGPAARALAEPRCPAAPRRSRRRAAAPPRRRWPRRRRPAARPGRRARSRTPAPAPAGPPRSRRRRRRARRAASRAPASGRSPPPPRRSPPPASRGSG